MSASWPALVCCALALLVGPAVSAGGGPGPDHADLPYVAAADASQTLDIYRPDTPGAVPAVVLFPGAGADKRDPALLDVVRHVVALGYAAVAVNYRQHLPDALHDAVCAVGWLRDAGQRYGVDARRIVLLGFSLGGQLAATLGTMDDPAPFEVACPGAWPDDPVVRGVVTLGGALGTPKDLLRPAARAFYTTYSRFKIQHVEAAFDDLLAYPPGEWRDNLALSPEAQTFARWLPLYALDENDPPFLLLHGLNDAVIPPGVSVSFGRALADAGVEARVLLATNAEHVFRLHVHLDNAFARFLRTVFRTPAPNKS